MSDLDEDALQDIYTWIDDIPLSRPKKNIARDFSDGVLVAEIIHHFLPKMVDLHNYISASSSTQKLDNWNLLSRKCFSKLYFNPPEEHIKGVVACKSGYIELILNDLRNSIESYIARRKAAALVEKNKIHDQFSDSPNSFEGSDKGSSSISSRESSHTRMNMKRQMSDDKLSYSHQHNMKTHTPSSNKIKQKPPSPRPKQAPSPRPKQAPSPRPIQALSPRSKYTPPSLKILNDTEVQKIRELSGGVRDIRTPPSKRQTYLQSSNKEVSKESPSQTSNDMKFASEEGLLLSDQNNVSGHEQKIIPQNEQAVGESSISLQSDSNTSQNENSQPDNHSINVTIKPNNPHTKTINQFSNTTLHKSNHINQNSKPSDNHSKQNTPSRHVRKGSAKSKKLVTDLSTSSDRKQPKGTPPNQRQVPQKQKENTPVQKDGKNISNPQEKPQVHLNAKGDFKETDEQPNVSQANIFHVSEEAVKPIETIPVETANRHLDYPEEIQTYPNLTFTSKFLKEYFKKDSPTRTNTSGTYVVHGSSPPSTPNKNIAVSGRISETSIKVDSPVVPQPNEEFTDQNRRSADVERSGDEVGNSHQDEGDAENNTSDNDNVYDISQGPYSFPAYTDPSYHNIQQQQGVFQDMDASSNYYQYTSQPHMVMGAQRNTVGGIDNQPHPQPPSSLDTSPRHVGNAQRKPVTNANKSKAKASSKPTSKTVNGNVDNGDVSTLRLQLEEKEQALLASQETVQILNAKIRRLEHLLHLKDMRIMELKGSQPAEDSGPTGGQPQQQQQQQQLPAHTNNVPVPPYFPSGSHQQQPVARPPIINGAQPRYQFTGQRFPSQPQPSHYSNQSTNNGVVRGGIAPQYNYATGKLNFHAPLPDIPKSPPTYEYNAR